MDQLDLIKLLDRDNVEKEILDFLKTFDNEKRCLTTRRGLYLYGASGTGKTHLIKNILKKNNYDIIYYDASDVRNKSIIENITFNTMSDVNVLSMFKKKQKKIVIVMDEIGGMNTGDKGGINQLIKLIRQKKTKSQKKEKYTLNPIICISNTHVDKKILELRKVCNELELKTPTNQQIHRILKNLIPDIDEANLHLLTKYVSYDLRKVNFIYNLFKNENELNIINNYDLFFRAKYFENDTKQIIKKLYKTKFEMDEHMNLISETDRTSIALLYHENIIDVFKKKDKKKYIEFYTKILNNICFSDYFDRITFQRQIWCFNEMTSLLKTFYNNKLLHENIKNRTIPEEIRFTKVLTKYSTEYNNSTFLQNLCQKLNIGLSDLKLLMTTLKNNNSMEEIYKKLEVYDLTNLEINRIMRFYKLDT